MPNILPTTVEELIKDLKKYDKDKNIYIQDNESGNERKFLCLSEYEDRIILFYE